MPNVTSKCPRTIPNQNTGTTSLHKRILTCDVSSLSFVEGGTWTKEALKYGNHFFFV